MEQVLDYALRPGRQTQGRSTTTNWVGVLKAWHDRYTQRRELLQLDDRLLDDIGLTRADAEAEAGKPFWKR